MTAPIQFSSAALEAFRSQVRKNPSLVKAVRLGVKGGSCSGLQYVIEFDYATTKSKDIEWNPIGWDEYVYTDEFGLQPVMFRVDKKSVLYLTGSTVDWKSTLLKSGFEFENPNEANRCGCGSSFSAK